MNNYIQISFTDCPPETVDILVAELSEAGFEGFEEKEHSLLAYIKEEALNVELLNRLKDAYQINWSAEIIPPTNWNSVWESSFTPVIVDDFCAIRAEFHLPVNKVEQEIIITPKQSFGTGHHATTYMMIQQMRLIDFRSKEVFDFGTGTGVLAILAEKLGAGKILAIDNDDWSIENASENLDRNNCTRIQLEKAQEVPEGQKFDIILANINKNVILSNLQSLYAALASGGILLLSGLLPADKEEIVSTADLLHLDLEQFSQKEYWISLKFSKLDKARG